jgi:DnaJ-class molecular chaperone
MSPRAALEFIKILTRAFWQFKELTKAYEILSDEEKRKLYDEGGEEVRADAMQGHIVSKMRANLIDEIVFQRMQQDVQLPLFYFQETLGACGQTLTWPTASYRSG